MSKTILPTTITANTKPKINFVRQRGQAITSFPIEHKKSVEMLVETSRLQEDIQTKRKSTIIDTIQLEYSPENERHVAK